MWLAALAFAIQPARADVTEARGQRHNGPASSEAHAVAVDGSGNVVVTGSSWAPNPGIGGVNYYTAATLSALSPSPRDWRNQQNPANSRWIHRTEWFRHYTPALSVGQSREIRCGAPNFQHPTLRTGTRCFVFADSEYQVQESNEQNNGGWFFFPR